MSNWQCKECGEVCEPQFDACWKCGASNDDADPGPDHTSAISDAEPENSALAEITSRLGKQEHEIRILRSQVGILWMIVAAALLVALFLIGYKLDG